MLAIGALGVLSSAPALAHTGLDTSTPADGSTVDGPLAQIELTFTGTPTAIDDGIVAIDAAGTEIAPAEVAQDGLVIVARFDPALEGGAYTVFWRVRSDDTHTVDGSVSFSVSPAAPAPTAPATTTPAVPPPGGTTPGDTVAGDSTPGDTNPVASEPVTTEPAAAAPATTEPAVAEPSSAAPPASPPPPAAFAEVSEGETTADIGRLVLFPSAVAAIGVLVFAGWAFAGRPDELATLIRLVRWLGVGVVLGATIEIVGLETIVGGLGALFDETAGWAAMARLLGGVLLVIGAVAVLPSSSSPRVGSPRSLSSATRVDDPPTPQLDQAPPTVARWSPSGRNVLAVLGAVLIVGSFAFDGHTLSEGPRVVHALASVAHVAAAAVWCGGLVAFAVVLWRRHRDDAASSALEMTLRFSVAAMVSLAVAALAGVVMALFIESDLGSYVSTDWGRTLLIKLGLVAVAGTIGAYNHFVVLPSLERDPTSEAVLARARTAVTAEAALLVGAAVVSAFLVAASTI